MAQRMCVAPVLMHRRKLLMADELTAGRRVTIRGQLST
jgi:ABC-type dipeptide/oligopeptide/nickel transport system ATPase component